MRGAQRAPRASLGLALRRNSFRYLPQRPLEGSLVLVAFECSSGLLELVYLCRIGLMAVFSSDHREPPPIESISDICIDESSQTKNRFLLLGGVIIPKESVAAAEARLAAARLPGLPFGEIKWGKASRSKLSAYRRFVDRFFDAAEFRHCHFHSLGQRGEEGGPSKPKTRCASTLFLTKHGLAMKKQSSSGCYWLSLLVANRC